MEKKFLFELITPSKTLVSNEFDMVVVPGAEGDFGVLQNHSNLISMLRPGILKTYNNNKVDKEFFLYSGFADVTSDKLTVLSDIALEKNEFDLKFEKENLVRLEQEKNKTKDEKESLYIEEKIKKINKMIEMLG
jgi:F-type H+-transporting ATPase subunit epsilon|tara:strand:- start:12 stop:413 length:402 start_codon:yes stop_codon:yes gene_type:complete